jgi:hypothetical protein
MVLWESVGIQLSFHTVRFQIGLKNLAIFQISHTVHLAFLHCSSVLDMLSFFFLIQGVFKYLNDSNL